MTREEVKCKREQYYQKINTKYCFFFGFFFFFFLQIITVYQQTKMKKINKKKPRKKTIGRTKTVSLILMDLCFVDASNLQKQKNENE